MAIEKMKLINIIGNVDDFDRIVSQHIIGTEIHMENIFGIISNNSGMFPYGTDNTYSELYKNTLEVLDAIGVDVNKMNLEKHDMDVKDIKDYVDALTTMVSTMTRQRSLMLRNLEENNDILQQLAPISDADIVLDDLFNLRHIKVRFGFMPKDSYTQMDTFLSNYESLFLKLGEENDKVYGVYFAPTKQEEQIDSIYSSLYFQRTRISANAHGKPIDAIENITAENNAINDKLDYIKKQIDKIIEREYDKLCNAYASIKFLYDVYSVRKYAAHTELSFYLAGWVPVDSINDMQKEFDKEKDTVFIVEEADIVDNIVPPTKLKNNKLIKPFESYVKMYGVPSYNEMDPTALFALTYSIMFGIMYGDVGHGLVLALLGWLMAKKKNFLGPILVLCGIVSSIFGVLFGSIFGNEEIIEKCLFRPFASENIMTTLIIAVGIGVVLISIAMVMNIINGIKQKDKGRVLFDPNGIAGLVFYWSVIIAVLAIIMGNSTLKAWYFILFMVIPLVLMFLKEPLGRLLEKKKDWMPNSIGQYILETFFEMFELLLSYITNTISFIRVGAFALIHAGMLSVVFTLADMSAGTSSYIVMIIGNIIVIGLEGLLVSIQVLRLEFYEMFSRYYSGVGREFKKLGGF